MNTNDLRDQIRGLRDEIVNLRDQRAPTLEQWNKSQEELEFRPSDILKLRKSIVNKSQGEVKGVDFGRDKQFMTMTAGAQSEGVVLVWNIDTLLRTNYIQMQSVWATCGKMEKTEGQLIGLGDLSGEYHIYNIRDTSVISKNNPPSCELFGHEAAIYSSQFMGRDKVVSASGDKSVKVWDTQRSTTIATLMGHTGDVLSCDVSSNRLDIIISGGCDFSARLWDVRRNDRRRGAVNTFDTKSRDVNWVEFFPEGNAFGAALSNSETHLYDIRASCKLAMFCHSELYRQTSAEQVSFSPSGRLMFVRYSNKVIVYDVTATPTENDFRVPGLWVKEGSQLPGINKPVSMAIHAEGHCMGVGDETANTNTTARLFWPKPGRR